MKHIIIALSILFLPLRAFSNSSSLNIDSQEYCDYEDILAKTIQIQNELQALKERLFTLEVILFEKLSFTDTSTLYLRN